jgi:hypothetical protein
MNALINIIAFQNPFAWNTLPVLNWYVQKNNILRDQIQHFGIIINCYWFCRKFKWVIDIHFEWLVNYLEILVFSKNS